MSMTFVARCLRLAVFWPTVVFSSQAIGEDVARTLDIYCIDIDEQSQMVVIGTVACIHEIAQDDASIISKKDSS